jgi:hypothetical protein
VTDDTLTWDNHTDQLISTLNSARYAIRSVKEMMSMNAQRMLYFSYAHSVIAYGIFSGTAPNSMKILITQKKKNYKNYNQLEENEFM